jgi:hypothetical protein
MFTGTRRAATPNAGADLRRIGAVGISRITKE